MKHTLLIMATLAALSAPALADEALAKSKNCMACHAVDRKLVGPSYKDIAKKYAADAKAVEMLAGKIQKGGSGVWGPIPMPANPQVNDADAKKLAQWVMGMK
ncbi:MAG TPA: c-type cytochrome [Hydrogenophaga sp.]|uniref:c-type cytochrome n=1 Tax=Hydrogenophaga sp. TaxID=1904254 RepID=UPI002C4F8DAC|nr:c-type cytochrome [Hydrogenophaga sp.]HMN93723.1 c-type cytochrome [Hydrogenophaga sp.]HMP09160.1 c-type cytochrome [Hydrogenophaga sp.]